MTRRNRLASLGSLMFAVLLMMALFGALLWTVQSSRAATFDVEVGESIQAAIDSAGSGDTIRVQSGVFPESLVITKSLTLEGGYDSAFENRDPRTSIISLTTEGRVIKVEGSNLDVTIDGFEIKGGDTIGDPGSGLYADLVGGILRISDNILRDNTTNVEGGGVYLNLSQGADILITETEVVSNSALHGSGVYALLDEASHLRVIGNELEGNISSGQGGGIYTELSLESWVDIMHNNIISNYASNAGGGIFVEGEDRTTVTINDNIVARNVVSSNSSTGAGIYATLIMSGTFRLNNNQVMTNTNRGSLNASVGGIYAVLSDFISFEAQNNVIFGNEAKEKGGIDLTVTKSVEGTFEYNDVYDNEARTGSYGGGSFSLTDDVKMAFRDNDFHSNRADEYGGLFIEIKNNSHLTGDRLSLSDNFATKYGGGGIDVSYNSAFTMTEGITITGNVAQESEVGGLSFVGESNSQFFVPNMYVVGNMSQGDKAGGLEIDLDVINTGGLNTLIATGSQILNNTSASDGGGVWADLGSKGAIDLSDSIFAYNVVTDTGAEGGGLYLDGFKALAELDLQNTEFVSNAADQGGGAYLSGPVNDAYLNLRSATFISNTARSSDGGGLYVGNSSNWAQIDAEDMIFKFNSAGGAGGGAYFSPSDLLGGAHLNLRSAMFISNTAQGSDGGGLYVGNQSNRAQVYAEDMTFKFNSSSGNGGGMYLSRMRRGAEIALDRSVFLSNTAVLAGGGFYGDQVQTGSSFRQVRGAFSHNQAGTNGGAVYWGDGASGSTFQFDHITMTHNVAVGGGGGMYVNGTLANDGAWVSLTRNRILSNTAQGIDIDNTHGGGIFLDKMATNGSTVYFNRNILQNNKAGEGFDGNGGGARLGDIDSSDVEIRENQIVENTATDSGGGLHIGKVSKGSLDLSGNEISQNTIYSNAVRHGGGVYFDQMEKGAVITMTGNTIVNNRATGNGGGCYVEGTGWGIYDGVVFIFRQNHVDHNIADQDGGGCYFVNEKKILKSLLEFMDNTFNYNTAGGNYGGVFVAELENSRLRFWDNQLIGNRAGISDTIKTGGDGGGIYFTAINKGSIVDFRDNDVISNTVYISPTGGGAYGGLYAYANEGSLLTIQGSRFEHNEAESDYAGITAELEENSRLVMARSIVSGNLAMGKNGGVSIFSLSKSSAHFGQYFLERNKIINNSSAERCGLSITDIESMGDYAPPLWGRSTNNVIAGNSCGVYLENVDFRSTNDTIADNVGAGLSVSGTFTSTMYFDNGILWDNGVNLTTTDPLTQSLIVATYSDIQLESGVWPGDGNRNDDPHFENPEDRDYHPKINSPVVNRIPPVLAPVVDHDGVPRPVGEESDMGAYEYRVPGVRVAGDGLLTGDPGEMVTHTVTIENSGTAQDAFDLTLHDNTWPSTLSTGEVILEAGESLSVYVWVEVPLGLSRWVTDSVRVIATSQRNAGKTHSDAVETEVGLAPAVSLTPDNRAVASVNSVQRYQHIIVNEGNGEDIFEIDADSSLGWGVSVDPSSLTLAEGLSETIEVTVWVQEGTEGLVDTTVVTATSLFDNSAFDSASNNTTVVSSAPHAALSLTPDRGASVIAAQSYVYTHTLTNLAIQPDTFTLTATSDAGWPVALSGVTVTLNVSQSVSVSVTVTVPAGSEHQQVDVTTLTATSHRDRQVTDSVSDRTTALCPSDLELSTLTTNYVNADTSTDYVHRLTNWSHLTDTVELTVASSQGWPVTVTPLTVTVAGNTDRWVTVTVFVPLTSTHNEIDQTQLTAVSGNDGKQVSVVDMTVAQKPSDLALYPDRTATAIVGTDKVYTHTLVNDGDYTDTVSLEVSGPVSDWQADLRPTSVELAPGMLATVVVTVSVPVDEATGEHFLVNLDATSGNDGAIVVVTDLTTAQRPSHLSLTSNNPTGVPVGQQTTYYQHLLTNESALTDTVTLDATSSQGWTVDIGPQTVTLGPNMAATVAVTLSLPAEGSNGTMDITTVEARSDNGGGALAAAASDVTTLLNPASIQLQASQAFSTEAGSTVIYEHSLVNAGDYQDVFSLEAVSHQGWETILNPTQARLSPGEGVSITLRVTVPATATPGMVDRTTLSAISTYDREREAPVTNIDITYISGGKIYLPLVLRNL